MTTQNEFRIVGVVEKAQELHYTAHQIGFGGVLGKYIASLGFKVYREKKAWKGQMTEVNCYEDSAELADAINKFFDNQAENALLEPACKVKVKKQRVLAKDRLDPAYEQKSLF